ncbi:MAG: UDP-N-acetylglucosamine 4,6-dehydratase (inverting) [Rhodospirillaceae bacterium]|nr:UDP-N-acetylglucosamine 4,6-dehydratase (inverting) [Rhodospirillaceae bacterium]|tara:strand:+ start:172 stop:1206 length:1035 start_codon:yes stop_codon:yes gene_type:complete
MAENKTSKDTLRLNDKTILITGGTGSFGRHFVKTVLERYQPGKLIVFSRDEQKQYEMAQSFDMKTYPCLRYFIGDVRDAERLEMAMRDADYVIHAAALKHVPTAEYNPFECIRTNVHGAENIVNAAIRCGVDRVIALSTDKAVNPINLYGASKLAADKIFVAANNLSGMNGPKFAVVRYGNVLGSRGSVIPFFKKLIAEGATELPVTDKRMTRFWISLQQGIDFVLDCLADTEGGEIFVPKIPSMRIVDLARVIGPQLPLNEIGIRPGEKLHETLLTTHDASNALNFDDRYLIRPTGVVKLESHDYSLGGQPGTKVEDEFAYRSDTNDWWMTDEEIQQCLDELD